MNPHDRDLPFSIRELLAANRARMREDWQGFAYLLAMLHNVNCSDNRKAKSPDDFDLYSAEKPRKPLRTMKDQIAGLKGRWLGQNAKG